MILRTTTVTSFENRICQSSLLFPDLPIIPCAPLYRALHTTRARTFHEIQERLWRGRSYTKEDW